MTRGRYGLSGLTIISWQDEIMAGIVGSSDESKARLKRVVDELNERLEIKEAIDQVLDDIAPFIEVSPSRVFRPLNKYSSRVREVPAAPETPPAEVDSYGRPRTDKSLPPMPVFKGPTCRGSLKLGTACAKCEKCAWEESVWLKEQNTPQDRRKIEVTNPGSKKQEFIDPNFAPTTDDQLTAIIEDLSALQEGQLRVFGLALGFLALRLEALRPELYVTESAE